MINCTPDDFKDMFIDATFPGIQMLKASEICNTKMAILVHKLKCSEIHRENLEKEIKALKIKYESQLTNLQWEHKKNFWRKFIPRIKIQFLDEYEDD